ncbi:protein LAZ1 homolog 1-like isoform X1 [Henckelia pumila]|uniref:protein LAZ1 homolog 1-like isoform X1 n=1 Tax=Henckelia pumila TaxID=405737 RepID=UPI003C6E066E
MLVVEEYAGDGLITVKKTTIDSGISSNGQRDLPLLELLSLYLFIFIFTGKERHGFILERSDGKIGWAASKAAIFVVVALILSLFLIFEHLAAFKQPEVMGFIRG